MAKTVVFLSNSRVLSVSSDPVSMSTVVAGQVVSKLTNEMTVLFRDNRYETSDEKTIQFLRTHRAFGKLFWEMPEGAETAEKPAVAPKNVTGVKTKNDVLVYLANNGLGKEAVKGKTIIDLVELAKEKLNVVFTELNAK